MDVLARRRRLVLIFLAACAPKAGAPVGVSENRPVTHASSVAVAPPASVPNPIPADFRSKMTKIGARFASQGHFVGRYDAQIWASADALDPWNQSASFPDGARLIEEHLERGSDRVGPLMMMERRANAWRWTMVASDGRVILDGDANACATCHGEAPRDSVFVVR